MPLQSPKFGDLPNCCFVTIHSDSFHFVIFSWAHIGHTLGELFYKLASKVDIFRVSKHRGS